MKVFGAPLSTLHITLGVSLALHAVALTVRFVDPERFDRVLRDTPLEVILVNAKGERPVQAQAVAQASLAGGGSAERGRATTPLPALSVSQSGDAPENARRRIEAMQQQQSLLLSQVHQQLALASHTETRAAADHPDLAAEEEKRRQLLRLLAEIERRINEENTRPRKRYVSPATREEAYALYYDALRRKIENKGTDNFPELGGRKLYGELTMLLTVNFDGQVLESQVVESSGHGALDRIAQTIARSAGPFGRFSAAMQRQADQIVVVSRFKFTRDEVLETNVGVPP